MRDAKGRFIKGVKSEFLGHTHSDESKEKNRLAHLGKKLSNEARAKLKGRKAWNKGITLSLETREKIRRANIGKKIPIETRLKISLQLMGEKNHNYIDGKMRNGKKHYFDLRWKLWKDELFKRDNWTCQICGIRVGKLEPHHIKSWTYFPELRYEITNGQTLCRKCHKLTDNYCGRGIRKKLSHNLSNKETNKIALKIY